MVSDSCIGDLVLSLSCLVNPSFDLTCAVPRTGRTLINFLCKLKSFDANSEEIDQIVEILKI